MDHLTDIAVFTRVVQRANFTRAAEELELSRAVVSKYVSRLEERLGVLMAPTFYVGALLREGKLKRFLTRYRLPELGIYAVYPQRSHVPPKVRAFVDFLARRFGPKPDWERLT